jgi:hypothetical protein
MPRVQPPPFPVPSEAPYSFQNRLSSSRILTAAESVYCRLAPAHCRVISTERDCQIQGRRGQVCSEAISDFRVKFTSIAIHSMSAMSRVPMLKISIHSVCAVKGEMDWQRPFLGSDSSSCRETASLVLLQALHALSAVHVPLTALLFGKRLKHRLLYGPEPHEPSYQASKPLGLFPTHHSLGTVYPLHLHPTYIIPLGTHQCRRPALFPDHALTLGLPFSMSTKIG